MIEKKTCTMGDILTQIPKNALLEDYFMLYSGLEVAVALLKERDLSREEWSTLHSIVKDYLMDRANRDKEDYTMYTDKIYEWYEEIFEEIRKR